MREYYCTRCKESFDDPVLMCWVKGEVRRRCKKCHSEEEKVRRSKKTKEELKSLSDTHYKTKLKKLSVLDEENPQDLEYAISRWCTVNINRNSEKRFKSRKDLNREQLKELCYKAKELFPYITFNNSRKGEYTSAFWASLDRVNPNKPYADDNIIVVPLWLNSAKLDSSYEEMFNLFDMIDRDKFLKHVENCKQG